MAEINHSQRAHARLSASSSARWLACPPSALAAELYPSTDTVYTREGTRAHEVAEVVALARIEGRDLSHFPWRDDVDHEMLECAKGYADYIQELIQDENAVVLLEQRLDFSPWVPDGFGTGDCIILQGHRMDVVDYKYGQGVAVSAEGNSQMRLYGLGALHEFGDIYDIEEVHLHIYQPRKNNVSWERLTVPQLLAWGERTVKPTAVLAAAGKGDYTSGDHCRFCPHAGACPALARDCLKAMDDYGGKPSVPSLAPVQVAAILSQEAVITAWLKAVKDRALASLLDGKEVPGYKVVAGRASRSWADDLEVAGALRAAGFKPEDYTKTEVLSPAAMEKALGKKRVAELVGGQILSVPGSPTIAPESDKRPVYDRLAEARNDFA